LKIADYRSSMRATCRRRTADTGYHLAVMFLPWLRLASTTAAAI
jgi:hypothetical protein